MARTFPGNTANYLNAGDYDIAPPYLTVSLWVKDFGSTNSNLIGKWGGSAQEWVIQGLDASKHFLYAVTTAFSGSYTIINGAGVTQPGAWAHVAMVQDASTMTGYLNGKYDGSGTARSWANSTEAIWIGRAGDGGPLNGSLAQIAVWQAALTPNEIIRLAQGASPLNIRRTVGQLLIYLPMDKWSGGNEVSVTPAAVSFAMTGTVGFEPTPAPLVPTAQGGIPFAIEVPTVGADIAPPELNLGVGLRTPAVVAPVFPPFLSVGVGIVSATVVDGDPPPFVPPSLPPTLGSGPGGGSVPVGPGVPLPPLSSGGLAGIRFYQGPPWRWVVTDPLTNTVTFLDRLAFAVQVRYILNRTSTAKLSVPSDNPEVNILHNWVPPPGPTTFTGPFVEEGDRLLYGFRREGDSPLWVCRYGGTILQTEDTGETENARTVLTAADPWQLLYQRPMRNILADFPDKAGFFSFNDTQTGVIALTWLRNTILNEGPVGIDVPTTGQLAGFGITLVDMPGSGYWSGTIENTTQIDIDFQQGMSVGEIWDQLVQEGYMDIVLTPVYDPVRRPGITHEINIYERAGRQADDAVMAWDKPSRNLISFNHVKDGYKRANTVRYYEQQGGKPVGGGIPIADGTSVLRYGEYWAQQFFPGRIQEAVLAFAELQLLLRADGIDTVTIEPTPERAPFLFTEWFIGDTVPVFASDRARAAVNGFQRIYGIELNVDENSYERLPQVLGSPEDA